ncbi:uncharacterized protein V6R79_018648 [Siganus canaliculatus]
MSCPVNLQALPSGVFEAVVTPENVRGRTVMNSVSQLSFPKSRSALWDGSSAGDKLLLQLCSHRKPRLVLLEKALRLAQRHARHSNKPRLHCFFLGSISVDADEEGVTVTLDRFDPGREQAGAPGRVPSALLPGDVLVPCLFSMQSESSSDTVIQSEAELHHGFKVLQQFVSSRQTLDLSQLLKVKGRVVCSQQSNAATFGLSWSSVCPSVGVSVQPIRAVPIIPTALLRSLTSISRPHAASRQRGFLTMDQTRKLLLLLESDPKASNLPLVGLWLSGVTHVHNPQVWAWCLRFLFSSTLQDRVFSESRCFLLVLFGSTHRAPQFFQCQGPGSAPEAKLDYQLLTASQCITLYQTASMEGQTLQCELGSDHLRRQMEVFRQAQSSFSSAPPSAPGLSVSDQDSGVEDEDLSPRPSPSPHLPVQQARRVQPSVPELSLLMDGSFTARPPPAPAAGSTITTSSVPRPPPVPTPPPPLPHHHSTPNSNLQQPCPCCPSQNYDCTSIFPSPGLHQAAGPPPAPSRHSTPPITSDPASPPWFPPPSFGIQCCDPAGGVLPTDPYQLLLQQDRQLRLLQAQVQMLLEAQGKLQSSSRPIDTQVARSTASVAVGTGASLFWGNPAEPLPHQDVEAPPPTATNVPSSPVRPTSSPSSSSPFCRPPSQADVSIFWPGGGDAAEQVAAVSPDQQSALQSPVLGESASMYRPADDEQNFYHDLMTQLNSRLQESDIGQEVVAEKEEKKNEEEMVKKPLVSNSSHLSQSTQSTQSSQSSQSSRGKKRSDGDSVVSATLRQLQQLGVDVDKGELRESDRRLHQTVESSSTLAGINPAAVLSRLSVSEPSVSALFPGGSVDLSLEANAIALRYLSDSQLSRLSLGGHAPQPHPKSSCDSLLSPSNMSLATRKYMKRYGLIEEEEEEEEEEEDDRKEAAFQPLAEVHNVKLLPQSQLIRDLRPKMQLLADAAKPSKPEKENCSGRRPSLVRANSRETEGSVGNILDLSRLRQLPKLF